MLGTPVTDGIFMSGQINTTGSTGNASLDIPISGPKGKGNLYVEATKSAGVWTYTTLEVSVSGLTERIQLAKP